MKKLFFFLAALMLSFTAQAAVVKAHPNGAEANVLSWFLSQANAGDTLILGVNENDSVYIQPSSLAFDKEGLVVKAAEGTKPVIALTDEGGWTTMKVDATTTFDGVTFDGKGVTKYPVYINGTAVKKATFVNCEFKNYVKYAISDPYGGGTHVDSLIVNNCYFHDGGEAVYISKYGLEGQHGCNYCEVTNSTLYKLTTSDYAGMIHVSSCNEATGAQNEVVIDHVTLYDYTGSGLGGIAIRKSSNLKISNSIIANPSDKTGFYAFYIYGGTIDNTLYYNTTDDADATHTACLTVDPVFVDAANGNLALAEGSPAIGAATDGSNLGDPRWNAPAVEEEYEVMDITMTNLVVEEMEGYLVLTASDDDNTGLNVMLALNADGTVSEMSYAAIVAGWNETELPILEGKITKTYSEELATDVYSGLIVVEYMGGKLGVNLTMYAVPVKVVDVVVNDATITVEELPDGVGGTYELINVSAKWNESTLWIEGIEKEFTGFVQIKETFMVDGEEDWYIWMGQKAVVTTVDNVLTVTGEFKNNFTGDVYNVTISGKLPAKEEPALPVRAWAYGLDLVVEGDQYNFSYTASTAAKATLLLLDEAGAEVKSVDLGDVKPGKNTAVLAANEIPVAKKCTWAVKLEGDTVAALVEITDASKGIYNYYLPQDVAVDNNPYSATFGQIYVIGMDGASDGGSDRAKTQKRGVFVYNQHLDELNPTNVGYLPANAAPLMTDVSRQAVHRMAVNPVTNHVAFAYNVEGASAIWSMNPANMAGDAVNLIEGLAITKANALCFDEKGVLYVMDNANTSDGGKIVKVVDGELVTVAQNAIWGVQDISLVSDGRGGLWIAQNRWAVDAYAVLSHVNAEGVVDFKVTGDSPEEVKALFPNDANASYRGQCAYYAEEDILAFGGNKVVTLFQVTYNDTTGVPSIAKVLSTPALGGNIDGVAFDYAGDLYVVSASSERFYKFAVPTTNNAYTVAANHTIYIPEPTVLNPFAYALSSVLSEDATMLTVNYSLNANAKAVDLVILDGDSVLNTIACDGIYKGSYTVNVPTAELPTGVELTWKVVVTGTSVTAPVENPVNYSLYHPSAVDIDNNPENPTFGLILTNEGMHKVKNVDGYLSTGYGAGIYAFTPDFMPIKNGENPGFNGGVEFTETRADNASATAYSPRRIRISEDGRIFVTSLNTDGNYLWEVNADNMNEWTPVFKGDTLNAQAELITADSAFIAAPNIGFDVKGAGENLQLAMYSANIAGIGTAMGGFRLDEYNLGTATEWATAPTKNLVAGKYAINYTGTQVEYDNEGGFWIASYRGTASDANPGLVHINAQGVEDAKLVWNNVRQAGIRFNNDFTKLVVAGNNGSAKKATVYAISKDENGAPVLTEELVINMATVGNNLNDFAWDYAGNLYSCGNSSEKIVSWAMPYSGVVATPAAAKYAFQIEEPEPSYVVYEEEITNLVIDYDNMLLIGGPSDALLVEVMLGLGDFNRNDGTYQLKPESYVGIQGSDATFVEGYASVDGIDQTAEAVVRCVWNGMNIELHLTMSAAALEAIVVVVEDAVLEIEKYLLFGDMYDYALKMTGVWKDSTGVEYPVLVEVPVYYPEAIEPYEMYSTVTVGGKGDEDPWLGFGEGYLTITPEGEKITATGVVENPMAGIAIDITISGNLPGTAVDNIPVTVKAMKVVKNGQLVIIKGDVEYNAQGAVIK